MFWMDHQKAGKRGVVWLEGGDKEEDGYWEEGRDILLDLIAMKTTTGNNYTVEVTLLAAEARKQATNTIPC